MAIAGATVDALQNGVVQATTSTSSSGAYALPNLTAGSYDVRVSATNYQVQTQPGVMVTNGVTTTANFNLVPVTGGTETINGTVTSSSVAVAGATVEALQSGQAQATTSTSSSGTYALPNLIAGSYDVRVSATNYLTQTQLGITVTSGATTTANFDLVPSGGGGPSGDTVTYYHTDAIGSVRMITDPAGQVVARYDFLPFGVAWNPPTNPDVRQFTGQERDPETGFDYVGARYYASQTGRFTRPDDPGYADPFDPQSMNLYAYAYNNPLRFVDPDGHAGDCVVGYDSSTGLCQPDFELISFFLDSWFRPFGTTVQHVAQPVTNWLATPRDPTCLAGSAGIGASVGSMAGGIIGGVGGGAGGAFGGTLIAPGVGTIGGGFGGGAAGFAQGTAVGVLAGSAVGGAIGSVTCMGSASGGGGGGGGNRQENRAFREAVRRIEKALGKQLRPDQVDQLHREISKQNYSLREIVELGSAMFRR